MALILIADQYTNFATSLLASGQSSGYLQVGDTQMTLLAGDGAKFPATAPFTLVLGPNTSAPELVKVTNRIGDTLTIQRGQENTPANNWPVNTTVEQIISAGNMANIWSSMQNVANQIPTQVIITGETAGNDVIKAQPTGYASPSIYAKDDGTFSIYGASGAGYQTFLSIQPGATPIVTLHGTADSATIASGLASGSQIQTTTANIGTKFQDSTSTTAVQLVPYAPNGTARALALGGLDSAGQIHIGLTVNPDGTVAGLASSATSIIFVNENAPTVLVKASPVGYTTTPTTLLQDDGTFILRGLSQNTEIDFINITPGGASNYSSYIFGPLSITSRIFNSSVNLNLSGIVSPPAAPTLALATGTTLGVGAYQYAYTDVANDGGETLLGTSASITTTTNNQAVNLSAVAVGPSGTMKRNIYRTKVGGSTFYLLATLNNNTATTYSDTIADASLSTTTSPTHPTFGSTLRILNGSSSTVLTMGGDGSIVGAGSLSFDGGNISSNGSGRLSFGTGSGAARLDYYATTNATQLWTPQSGVAQWLEFVTWNGSATKVPFGVGSQANGNATSYVDDSGNLNAASITGTGNVTIAGVTTGMTIYRTSLSGSSYAFVYNVLDQTTGNTTGHVFQTRNGATGYNVFSLGGNLGGSLAYIDNTGALFTSGTIQGHGYHASSLNNSVDDSIYIYDRSEILGTTLGWAQSGGGLYAYDRVNNAYIFQSGTKNGISFNGNISAPGPIILQAGHQESGVCGIGAYISSASTNLVQAVNFKTQLTHAPTSITFSSVYTLNVGSPNADLFSVNGFRFYVVNSAVGNTQWFGSYTTVGNCLLGVDTTAQTFDHHCDGCDTVTRRNPLTALTVNHLTSDQTAISYVCPTCGTSEAFYAGVTAADTADTSPQGSGQYATTRGVQATYIRSLLTLLNIPLAA